MPSHRSSLATGIGSTAYPHRRYTSAYTTSLLASPLSDDPSLASDHERGRRRQSSGHASSSTESDTSSGASHSSGRRSLGGRHRHRGHTHRPRPVGDERGHASADPYYSLRGTVMGDDGRLRRSWRAVIRKYTRERPHLGTWVRSSLPYLERRYDGLAREVPIALPPRIDAFYAVSHDDVVHSTTCTDAGPVAQQGDAETIPLGDDHQGQHVANRTAFSPCIPLVANQDRQECRDDDALAAGAQKPKKRSSRLFDSLRRRFSRTNRIGRRAETTSAIGADGMSSADGTSRASAPCAAPRSRSLDAEATAVNEGIRHVCGQRVSSAEVVRRGSPQGQASLVPSQARKERHAHAHPRTGVSTAAAGAPPANPHPKPMTTLIGEALFREGEMNLLAYDVHGAYRSTVAAAERAYFREQMRHRDAPVVVHLRPSHQRAFCTMALTQGQFLRGVLQWRIQQLQRRQSWSSVSDGQLVYDQVALQPSHTHPAPSEPTSPSLARGSRHPLRVSHGTAPPTVHVPPPRAARHAPYATEDHRPDHHQPLGGSHSLQCTPLTSAPLPLSSFAATPTVGLSTSGPDWESVATTRTVDLTESIDVLHDVNSSVWLTTCGSGVEGPPSPVVVASSLRSDATGGVSHSRTSRCLPTSTRPSPLSEPLEERRHSRLGRLVRDVLPRRRRHDESIQSAPQTPMLVASSSGQVCPHSTGMEAVQGTESVDQVSCASSRLSTPPGAGLDLKVDETRVGPSSTALVVAPANPLPRRPAPIAALHHHVRLHPRHFHLRRRRRAACMHTVPASEHARDIICPSSPATAHRPDLETRPLTSPVGSPVPVAAGRRQRLRDRLHRRRRPAQSTSRTHLTGSRAGKMMVSPETVARVRVERQRMERARRRAKKRGDRCPRHFHGDLSHTTSECTCSTSSLYASPQPHCHHSRHPPEGVCPSCVRARTQRSLVPVPVSYEEIMENRQLLSKERRALLRFHEAPLAYRRLSSEERYGTPVPYLPNTFA